MKILILALSRSASTAMFYNLLAAMPKDSSSLFEPTFDFRPNIMTSKHLLVKWILEGDSPFALPQVLDKFDRIILIVRDPRDRLISSFLFSLHGVSESHFIERLELVARKIKDPGAYPFIKLISDIHPGWTTSTLAEYMRTILESFISLDATLQGHLRIHYEDYILHGSELLSSYIGVDEMPSFTIPKSHEYVKRRIIPADWKNWLTPTDVEFFRPILGKFILKYNYSTDWNLPQKQLISKEHSIEFTKSAFRKSQFFKKTGETWRSTFLSEKMTTNGNHL